jgi:hypothetical protein
MGTAASQRADANPPPSGQQTVRTDYFDIMIKPSPDKPGLQRVSIRDFRATTTPPPFKDVKPGALAQFKFPIATGEKASPDRIIQAAWYNPVGLLHDLTQFAQLDVDLDTDQVGRTIWDIFIQAAPGITDTALTIKAYLLHAPD